MNSSGNDQSIKQPRVSIRFMHRADRAIISNPLFVRWKSLELDPTAGHLENTSTTTHIDLVAERQNQIVGWLRATRTSLSADATGKQATRALKQAWWMQPADAWSNGSALQPDPQGDILLGTGMGILARLANSPTESAHIIAMMTEFGRNRLVRQLGLSRWIAQIPLTTSSAWQTVYTIPGYVQQLENGAIEDPLLSHYLRQGARILQVFEHQPTVWIVWENPVR